MLRITTITLLFLGLAIRSWAQPAGPTFPGASPVLVYQLDHETAAELYRDRLPFIFRDQLTQRVDSLSWEAARTKKRPPGHYVYNYVGESGEVRMLVTETDLEVFPELAEGEFRVRVLDKSGRSVDGAKVHWGGKPLELQGAGIYARKTKRRRGLLQVTRGKDEYLGWWYALEPRGTQRWRRATKRLLKRTGQTLRRPFQGRVRGYIAFSRPRYRPGDTLRAKAFLVNQYNRPLRRKMCLQIIPTGDIFPVHLKVQKPERPGRYTLEWPLPDSLKLNQKYTLLVAPFLKRRPAMKAQFNYSDYLLREAQATLQAAKHQFNPEDPVTLRLQVTDANGQGMAGVRARLELECWELRDFRGDAIYLPETIWETTRELDSEGSLRLEIPDSVIGNLYGKFAVRAEVRTGQNELLRARDTWDRRSPGQRRPEIKYARGRLVSTGLQGRGVLFGWTETDTLVRRPVRLPLAEKVDPRVRQWALRTPKHVLYAPNSEDEPVRLRSYRHADSLHFRVQNPYEIGLAYTLRENRQPIAEGKIEGKEWRWSGLPRAGATYRLEVRYWWTGDPRTRRKTVHASEKLLSVTLDHPERVQPGETTQMRIQVRDAKGKPAPRIDLTTSAITAKFSEGNRPRVPAFSSPKTLSKKPKPRRYLPLRRRINTVFPLDEDCARMFSVDSTEWFQQQMPPGGWYLRHLPPPDGTTQFAPFAARSYLGDYQSFKAIWVDGQLIHATVDNPPSPYSFRIAPGFHHLRLLDDNHTIEVENVYFPAGKKVEIFIDPRRAPDFCRVRRTRRAWLRNEEETWREQMLWIKDENYDKEERRPALMGQGDRRRLIPKPRSWTNLGVFSPGPFWYLPRPGADTIRLNFRPGIGLLLRDGAVFLDSTRQREYQNWSFGEKSVRPEEFLEPEAEIARQHEIGRRWLVPDRFDFWSKESTGRQLVVKEDLRTGTAFFLLEEVAGRRLQFLGDWVGRISNLPPGRYRIWRCSREGAYFRGPEVEIAAPGTYYRRLRDADFVPDQRPDDRTLPSEWGVQLADYEEKLLPAAAGYLELTLRDQWTGESLVGQRISLRQKGQKVIFTKTDPEGKATFQPPVRGWAILQVEGPRESYQIDWKCDYYWEPGAVRRATLLVPYRAERTNLYRYRAFRKPFSLKLSPPTFKKRQRAMVPSFAVAPGPSLSESGPEIVLNETAAEAPGEEDYALVSSALGAPKKLKNNRAFPSPNQLRRNFADEAWWQPDLVTDDDGEAYFQVTFPDDLTAWEGWVAAMRGNRSGLTTARIQAFRDLVAQVQVPRFALVGDQVEVQGEVINRGEEPVEVATRFTINGRALAGQVQSVTRRGAESRAFSAVGDTATVAYALVKATDSTYFDGETRKMPILRPGMQKSYGGAAYLETDTVLRIVPNPQLGKAKLMVYARPLDYLLRALEPLEQYPHECMEQTASRLLALLARKRIATARSQKFRQDKEIRRLVRRLEDAQHADGSWGWWFEAEPHVFMTLHVGRALAAAQVQGYPSPALARGKEFLRTGLPLEANATNLVLLRLAAELGVALDYGARLAVYGVRKPSINDDIQIARIRQLAGLPFAAGTIWARHRTTVEGAYFWGEPGADLLLNEVQATLVVYRMLEEMGGNKAQLARIRPYFLARNARGLGENTFEAASVIDALLPYYLAQPFRRAEDARLDIRVGEKERLVESFPFVQEISSQPMQIRKRGAVPLFLAWEQTHWAADPEPIHDNFVVASHFTQAGDSVAVLRTGTLAEMVVSVDARRRADYVMLEVPIPAGCVSANRSGGSHPQEIHREYQRDRIVVYLNELPEGAHEFRIALEPRFAGKYQLNPAVVTPMYLPGAAGNNAIRTVEIRGD